VKKIMCGFLAAMFFAIVLPVYSQDVFVAGSVSGRATLWINGVAQTLSNESSFAASVYVSDGNVYVAGRVGLGPAERATLWVNGIPRTLSNERSFAHSVHVYGSNVYVAGGLGPFTTPGVGSDTRAVLWENGIPRTLINEPSTAHSVRVSGGNVYVFGQFQDSRGRSSLWVNGVLHPYAAPGSSSGGMHVINGNVYVARGRELLVNGTRQTLSGSMFPPRLRSVYVSGGDVYVAGDVPEDSESFFRSYFATLWTNGVPKILSNEHSQANAVRVSGRNVFIAGTVGIMENIRATFWVNGRPQRLSNERSNAHSIFVR